MLSKDVDQVVIGKSTFSLLLGMQLLQSGSNVLLLDDDRIGYGDLYERFISLVTSRAMTAWGEELDADPLINLSSYTRSVSQVFHLEAQGSTKQVQLGSSPWGNMLELGRKLGHPAGYHLPDKGNFDEEAILALERLGDHLYKFQSLSQLDSKTLVGMLPRDLVSWAEPIIAPYLGRKHLDLSKPWDAFFYTARAVFHNKFSLDFSAAEIWHLLIEALSPRYEIDADNLVNDLVGIYQLRGGQFKSTRVREWMFYKSSPWSLELSSYEGIIHPKKLIFMGSSCSPVGLELDSNEHVYISIQLDFEGEATALGNSGTIHFIFSPSDVGTDFGLWSVRESSSGAITMEVAVRQREGMKIDFLGSKLVERATGLMERTFPLAQATAVPNRLRLGREVWIDEHFHKPRRLRSELLLPATVRLRQVLAPGETERVRNVGYFGPAKRDRLGLISSLIDMKDSLPRLQ